MKIKIRLYTDGACSGNPGPGGYGVILKYNATVKELFGAYRLTTNNRMEILAVIKGLEVLKESCIVDIYTDSRLIVDSMMKGWALRWSRNNWMRNKKEKALNPDLWAILLEHSNTHELNFHWVRGHSGHKENERCDLLARQAIVSKELLKDEFYETSAT